MPSVSDSLASPENPAFKFCEFFAGGGMARAGLGHRWRCIFANDFDFKKSATYRQNWGDAELVTKDVRHVEVHDLPSNPDLAWASFPCQDLSLAGMGAGLRGDRSGTFWPFWSLIAALDAEGRGPRVLVLENVCGTLTSHGGKDFTAIADALAAAKYRFGALVIDSALFVPQSRPRLFILAVASDVEVPIHLTVSEPVMRWHTKALRAAHVRLSEETRSRWLWWSLPEPTQRTNGLADLIEENPQDVSWYTPVEANRLLEMMSPVNLAKVAEAQASGKRLVGTVYKRTRRDANGHKVQRAEIRFDDVAGCLRTASGGSSRQLIVVVHGQKVCARLMSSRETARLMGLPDDYQLPTNYNDAYHLTGDGVVVPVVRHLAVNLLEPILTGNVTAVTLAA